MTLPVKPVLIVDDDPDVRDVLGQFLTLEGFSVETARNGREALERLHNGELPGLILLDLMMPVMDGCTFRLEQAQDPHIAAIPVVVISAVHDANRRASKMGVDGCMMKPLEFDRLAGLVSQYCA
jgi:two-component system chemotaxis response regulator CheY